MVAARRRQAADLIVIDFPRVNFVVRLGLARFFIAVGVAVAHIVGVLLGPEARRISDEARANRMKRLYGGDFK